MQTSEIPQTVRDMAQRLVEEFHPELVIVFGSLARGDGTKDSDVDFMVVVREVQDRRALRVAMRRALNGMGLPKDLVVLSTAEYEEKRRIPGTIAYPADQEGRILYAA